MANKHDTSTDLRHMTEQIAINIDQALYDFLPVVRKILKRELPSIFVGPGTCFDEVERPDAQMKRWGIPATVCNSVISENVYEVFNAGQPYNGSTEALTSLNEDETCDVQLYASAWRNGNAMAFKRSQSAKRNWLTKQGFEAIPVSFSATPQSTDSIARLMTHQAVVAEADARRAKPTIERSPEIGAISDKVLALQT